MSKYVFRRLLMMIPVILGVSFILFSIMNLTPGDPARVILGENATQSDVDKLRQEMGLNENFFVRYGTYVKNAVMGDLGTSYRTNASVAKEIFSRFPYTMELSFWGIAIAVCFGIPIGIISAVRQYSVLDMTSLGASLILTSIPSFWLGLMLIYLFSLELDLLPATGVDSWENFIMPSVTLAATTLAVLIRMTRSTMLEVIRQDYIKTARAKGAGEGRIIFKHALRNALLPVVTIVGMNFGLQLGGTIIIESVFAMPGIGNLLITSVRMKDTPMVMGCVLLIAVVAGLVNLLVDILYSYIDPRIKSQYVKVSR